MMMKKFGALALSVVTAAGIATGCSAPSIGGDKDKLSIVCTIFPEYDWTKEILGSKFEDADVKYLLDKGADLHNFQPNANDLIAISECDLFIYVGGESDEWVEDALSTAKNKDMQVINLMEVMGDKAVEEEMKEGMQEEDEHEHDHGKEVSTFEDDEVKDRPLSDWEGEWQSAYPLVLDGSLDEAWEHKAEEGDMTAEEYKDYYEYGYKTDISSIKIDGDNISFTYNDGRTVSSDYEYNEVFIQEWSTGTRGAMYRFEAKNKRSGAPIYIEFNDHMIAPEKADHFHIRMSNQSYDAIVDPEGNWPTFFDAALSPEGVCDEIIGHGHNDDDEEEEEVEYDEHFWTSLRNAKIICGEICDSLCTLDSKNADAYKKNLASYSEKLDKMDNDFKALIDSASEKTLVFGDRFPFRYFVDDYGLDYYAAFVGCSAETEASFETITFLANKIDELEAGTVFVIENSDGSIANAIIRNTQSQNQKIAELNSMQSITADMVKNGTTYLGLMQKNYDVLKEALS